MVSQPSQYTAMGWHQSRSGGAAPGGDGFYKPESWDRPEFREGNLAKLARGILFQYLSDTPVALAHIGFMVNAYARPPGRAADRPGAEDGWPDLTTEQGTYAVRKVATWLDECLYGQGREQFPKEERYPLQATADDMARGDFCRMDFRRLVLDCLATGVPPAPISPRGAVRSA
ncbi:hypothetical protein [Streptomyces longwoodensis]|uniref:hypothetical protein n=1 Tax=Streptomyces longwoodensis TaxID=68231 RepID=UPI0036F90A00